MKRTNYHQRKNSSVYLLVLFTFFLIFAIYLIAENKLHIIGRAGELPSIDANDLPSSPQNTSRYIVQLESEPLISQLSQFPTFESQRMPGQAVTRSYRQPSQTQKTPNEIMRGLKKEHSRAIDDVNQALGKGLLPTGNSVAVPPGQKQNA